jgi:cell wall assembly regulator SMI1
VGGATTSPCSPEALTAAERRLGLRFPSDVCAFYRRTSGTADMTDSEHGLITFWPLEKWERVEDEAPQFAKDLQPTPSCSQTIRTGARPMRGTSRQTRRKMRVYLVGCGAPTSIAESFTEFVQLVLSGHENLYGNVR